MSREQKRSLLLIAAAAVLLIGLHFVPVTGWLKLVLYLIPYLLVGGETLADACKGIYNRQPFDENLLMAVATIGAMVLGDYPEAVSVMLFYQIGELFESYAVGRSRKNIGDLMDIRPDYANVETADGVTRVKPEQVAVGDTIVVKPGERVPLDGTVLTGTSALNMSALTGESAPVDVTEGSAVVSGSVNLSGVLRLRVEKVYAESTVARILELVENSSLKKAHTERFITKFARVYTPSVCGAALALAILPPVVRLIMGIPADWGEWVYRALTFLVISCPCALVISIPLSFFGGIGGASARGILIKGSSYLEMLAKTDRVVFDKTGTLTDACPQVAKVIPMEGYERQEILRIAACLEEHFPHSMAKAIVRQAELEHLAHREEHAEVKYVVAHGIASTLYGEQVLIGSAHFVFDDEQIPLSESEQKIIDTETNGYSTIFLAIGNKLAGIICIEDPVRPEAREVIQALKDLGIRHVMMLTGDSEHAAIAACRLLGITEYRSQVLPEDKASIIQELKAKGHTVVMTGDGINDSPALSAADASVAMKDGSDIAREVADIALLSKDLHRLVILRRLSMALMSRIHQNYRFILGFNTSLIAGGILGLLGPASSALLHNLSTMAVSIYSMKPFLPNEPERE